MKRYLSFCLLVVLAVVPYVNAQEQESDEAEENTFGVVDNINQEEAWVVIDDIVMDMALNLQVHNVKQKPVTRYFLKVGQKVRYALRPNARKDIVEAIWVLPDDTPRPEDE